MNTLRRMWELLDRRQRVRLLFVQASSLLMSLSTMIGTAAVIPFLSVIADAGIIHRYPRLEALYVYTGTGDERRFVLLLGAAFVALVVIGNAIALVCTWAIGRHANLVGSELRTALFSSYLHRGYGFHARADSSVLATRVLFETDRVAHGIEHGMLLVSAAFTISFIVAAMFLVNPLVSSCASALLAASYGSIYLSARRRVRRNGQLESRYAIERARFTSQGLGAIKEVIATQSQRYFLRQFAQMDLALARTQAHTQVLAQSPRYILESLTIAGLVVVALSLSGTPRTTVPWMAQIGFFAVSAYRMLPALQQLFHALVKIRSSAPAVEAISRDLRDAQGSQHASAPLDLAWRSRPEHEIRLEKVCFRFAPELPPALRDVSLVMPAGEIIAFVGANGAGKTALVDILLGLLVPESGTVQVDGVDIDASNRLAWQSTVAYVPQQIYMLDASIAENIALGFAGADIDDAGLRKAAHLAQLTEFIAALPAGFDTQLGERGIRLSGGMCQRIGIARALYRDAKLLVLDEATSALDSGTEQEVLHTLRALAGGRTIVLVAHGSRVLRVADRVFEVDGGLVSAGERGAPEAAKRAG